MVAAWDGPRVRDASGLPDSLTLLRPRPLETPVGSTVHIPSWHPRPWGALGSLDRWGWGRSIPACRPPSRQWLEDALRENEPGACFVFLVGTKKDLLVSGARRARRPRGTRSRG